jgi:hypothetical protein
MLIPENKAFFFARLMRMKRTTYLLRTGLSAVWPDRRRAACHMKGIGAAEGTVTEHPGLSQESVNIGYCQDLCNFAG